MKLKLCRSCLGAKKLLGMGGISYEKCKPCDGIGYVTDIEEKEVDELLNVPVPAIIEEEAPTLKPKYVRPSRAKKK